MKKLLLTLPLLALAPSLTGCWVAAGAVGAEAAYVGTQEDRTAGETLDDQGIHASVKSKLLADPDVSGLAVNVDVYKGVVALRGYAKTQSEIDRAVDLARKTSGVKAVDNKMVLDPSR